MKYNKGRSCNSTNKLKNTTYFQKNFHTDSFKDNVTL